MGEASTLGELEQVVILATMRLDDEAYGVSIRREIHQCTGRDISPGALHTTLDRLEGKGMLSSRFGDPTPQRGGRPKRFFSVTSEGAAAIRRAQQSYAKLMSGLVLPGGAHA